MLPDKFQFAEPAPVMSSNRTWEAVTVPLQVMVRVVPRVLLPKYILEFVELNPVKTRAWLIVWFVEIKTVSAAVGMIEKSYNVSDVVEMKPVQVIFEVPAVIVEPLAVNVVPDI
jgi:hypothetical protein